MIQEETKQREAGKSVRCPNGGFCHDDDWRQENKKLREVVNFLTDRETRRGLFDRIIFRLVPNSYKRYWGRTHEKE